MTAPQGRVELAMAGDPSGFGCVVLLRCAFQKIF
jgi:hypothetical protein